MNAAFLLVTTACFAGQTPALKGELVRPPAGAPTVVATTPGPVSSTVIPGGCGGAACDGGCNTCCPEKHKLFSKLGGLFNKGGDCDSCGGGHKHCHKMKSWGSSSCGCDTGCGSSGGGFFAKCKAKLGGFGNHGSACGCDGGCNSYSTGYAGGCANGGCAPSVINAPGAMPGGVPQGGEIINNPPKKMPTPPTKTVAPTPVRTGPLSQGSDLSPVPTAPSIEIVPPAIPAVPSITNEPRSPF